MTRTRQILKAFGVTALLLGLVTCSSSDDDPVGPTGQTGVGGGRPDVLSVSPTSGPAGGGTLVTITGNNLSSVVDIRFAGVPVKEPILVSPTELTVITGAHPNLNQNTPGDVVLTFAGGQIIRLANLWLYVSEAGLSITPSTSCPTLWPVEDPDTFIPSSVGLEDDDILCDFNQDGTFETASFPFTAVRIEGTNLDLVDRTPLIDGSVVSVWLAGVPVERIESQDDNSLIVDPGPAPGPVTGPIRVRMASGKEFTGGEFSYFPLGSNARAPVIDSVEPSSGPAAGGIEILIRGRNLADVTAVTFVNRSSLVEEVISATDTELRVILPRFIGTIPGDTITGPVTVFTGPTDDPETDQGTLNNAFTYVSALANAVCTGVDPLTGTEGTLVTVSGDSLGDLLNEPGQGEEPDPVRAGVEIDGTRLPDAAVNHASTDSDFEAEQVSFLLPRFCSDRQLEVELVDDFGQLLDACSATIDYEAPFEVDGSTPVSGDATGGTEVTINGCGLDGVVSVTVCGNAGTNLDIDPEGGLLTFETPPAPSGGGDVCDVIVTDDSGESVRLRDAFTYSEGLPDGQSIVPSVGPLCGGTQFRIFGENLSIVTTVTFGREGGTETAQATVVNITDTEILGITPGFPQFNALTPVVFDVFLTGPDPVTSEILEDPTPLKFVYGNPSLSTVTTCRRPGDTALLVGEGFRDPGSGVDFVQQVHITGNGVDVFVDATVLSETQIQFLVPPVPMSDDYTVEIVMVGDDDDCHVSDQLTMRIFIDEDDSVCAPGGCSDDVDNDNDGLVDEADPDCCTVGVGEPADVCDNPCLNEKDDDGDGLVDGFDVDCTGLGNGCTDGIDNNGNGLVDEAEPNCYGPNSCDDGLDNDNDGVFDCGDPDCPSCPAGTTCDMGSGDCVESNCTNGIDDDGDGDTDCVDPDCGCPSGASCNVVSFVCQETACDDATDNDGDGRADEADPDCCTVGVGDPPTLCDEPCINERDDNGDGETDGFAPECAAFGDGCSNSLDDDGDGVFDEGETACFGPGSCSDRIDNDGNGFADEADFGCFGIGSCSDTVDNDSDGCTDAADSNCGGTETVCNDGIDDDCDGLIDEADPDCCTVGVGEPGNVCDNPCVNEKDDDGDGVADGDDPNCAGLGDGCQDGLDNDGDTFFDEADPDCGSCTNGVDDDGDGLVDCNDFNCCNAPGNVCSGLGVCPP